MPSDSASGHATLGPAARGWRASQKNTYVRPVACRIRRAGQRILTVGHVYLPQNAGVVSADEQFTIIEGEDLAPFLENLDEGMLQLF